MEDEIIEDTPPPTEVPDVDAPAAEPAAVEAAVDAADAADAAADTPAADEPADQAGSTDASDEPHPLAMPGMTKDEEAEAYAPLLDSFAEVAPLAGIDCSTAQSVVDTFAQVAPLLARHTTRENTVTGEIEDLDLGDIDVAKSVARYALGDDAPVVQAAAAKYVRTRPALARWLDDHPALGNDPAVLVSLALASDGVYTTPPGAARDEVAKLTGDRKGAYHHGSVYAVAKVNALMRIITADNDVMAEVDQIRAAETAAAEDARVKAEADAEQRRLAQERVAASFKIQQETNLRNSKAAELRRVADDLARAAARDAAARRASRPAAPVAAPAAAPAGGAQPLSVSDARAEAMALLKSGALNGSGPEAAAAKARWHVLLAQIAV